MLTVPVFLCRSRGKVRSSLVQGKEVLSSFKDGNFYRPLDLSSNCSSSNPRFLYVESEIANRIKQCGSCTAHTCDSIFVVLTVISAWLRYVLHVPYTSQENPTKHRNWVMYLSIRKTASLFSPIMFHYFHKGHTTYPSVF